MGVAQIQLGIRISKKGNYWFTLIFQLYKFFLHLVTEINEEVLIIQKEVILILMLTKIPLVYITATLSVSHYTHQQEQCLSI